MPDASTHLRVLIVDDEDLARRRLARLLEQESDVSQVVVVENGREAVEAIRSASRTGFDMVFLDVQMPGLSGLDVVREVGPQSMPLTIFVTAYDEHALSAFELGAVDYLLKPFENDRFAQTLERARRLVRLKKVEKNQKRLRDLLTRGDVKPPEGGPDSGPQRTGYPERVAVEMRGRVRLLPVEEIDYFTAEGNFVNAHSGETTYVLSDTMASLEERLDPSSFFRIHRSTIVRLDRVESLLTAGGGEYAVRLRDGKTLRVARSRRDELADRLGIA